jgi:hypothetical protein
MTYKSKLEQKREKPSVAELEALVKAVPSITQLDKKIKREKEVKSKNIELIFNKSKKKK